MKASAILTSRQPMNIPVFFDNGRQQAGTVQLMAGYQPYPPPQQQRGTGGAGQSGQ